MGRLSNSGLYDFNPTKWEQIHDTRGRMLCGVIGRIFLASTDPNSPTITYDGRQIRYDYFVKRSLPITPIPSFWNSYITCLYNPTDSKIDAVYVSTLSGPAD